MVEPTGISRRRYQRHYSDASKITGIEAVQAEYSLLLVVEIGLETMFMYDPVADAIVSSKTSAGASTQNMRARRSHSLSYRQKRRHSRSECIWFGLGHVATNNGHLPALTLLMNSGAIMTTRDNLILMAGTLSCGPHDMIVSPVACFFFPAAVTFARWTIRVEAPWISMTLCYTDSVMKSRSNPAARLDVTPLQRARTCHTYDHDTL